MDKCGFIDAFSVTCNYIYKTKQTNKTQKIHYKLNTVTHYTIYAYSNNMIENEMY